MSGVLNMTDIITLISNVGFPIVISIYFIVRMEKTLYKNTEAINSMKDLVLTLHSGDMKNGRRK